MAEAGCASGPLPDAQKARHPCGPFFMHRFRRAAGREHALLLGPDWLINSAHGA
jgi:hypothetical protein